MNKHIILIGLRDSGKSSVGQALASLLKIEFIDTDSVLEALYYDKTGNKRNFKEIHIDLGEKEFRSLENIAIRSIDTSNQLIIATGGGSILNPDNVSLLKALGVVIFLDASHETLLARWRRDPPTFVTVPTIEQDLKKYYAYRKPICKKMADMTVDVNNKSINEIVSSIVEKLAITH